MTIDPVRFADLLCDWCLEVQAGQQIRIGSTTLAVELLDALHAAVLDRDAWPDHGPALAGVGRGLLRARA